MAWNWFSSPLISKASGEKRPKGSGCFGPPIKTQRVPIHRRDLVKFRLGPSIVLFCASLWGQTLQVGNVLNELDQQEESNREIARPGKSGKSPRNEHRISSPGSLKAVGNTHIQFRIIASRRAAPRHFDHSAERRKALPFLACCPPKALDCSSQN